MVELRKWDKFSAFGGMLNKTILANTNADNKPHHDDVEKVKHS